MNYQARRRLGCCVYLIHDADEWMLIDIGYEETVDEIVDMVRQMDFPLAQCKYVVASHADVDHVQGLHRLKQALPNAQIVAHPEAADLIEQGDRVTTYAEIPAQGISIDFKPVPVDRRVGEGDTLTIGGRMLNVWHTPGHTEGQLALQMDSLLFSGDNIYRDGGVGNIDAHHGSDIEQFIASLERIRDADEIEWLLPSHGPVFRRDPAMIQKTIDRLKGYLYLADFGTCAIGWPLMEEWEEELLRDFDPQAALPASTSQSTSQSE